MKISMHMMADALVDCCEWGQCTDASSRIFIDGVLPYDRNEAIEGGILYVVKARDAPLVLRDETETFAIVVGNVDRVDVSSACSFLVANEGIDFTKVLGLAAHTLRQFGKWHDALTDELLGTCDLNALCEIGSDLLQHPIMIYDRNYTVIGNSVPEDEAAFADFLEKRSSYYVTPPDAMSRLTTQSGFESTFKTRGAAVYHDENAPDGALGDRSLYVNITKGASYRGRVVIVYSGEDPRQGDFQIAEIFCRAAKAALDRPTLREGELDRVFRAFFASLIEGKPGDDRFSTDSLRLWNWEKNGRFVCLWAQLSNRALASEADAFLCYQLEMELPGSCAMRYENGIVCVSPLGVNDGVASALARFSDTIGAMASAIGASEEYAEVLTSSEYLIEARIAASMCAELGLQTCRFGDVALRHYHQFGCSKLPAVHFCDADVKRLSTYRGQRVDYYEVLKCYLEHNMSLLHTSEALFVHRTTLFNYLKEIRSIVQADLNDPTARMRIIASFQIMDLDAQYRRHVVQ